MNQNTIWDITRSFPVTILVILLIMVIINPNKKNMFILLYFTSAEFSNLIFFKPAAKGLYTILDIDTLPFLGQGKRPKGAKNCGAFISCDNINQLSTSYGMPSGHSQSAWLFTTYFALQVLESKSKNNMLKGLQILSLAAVGTLVSYSRVYVENCHTLQQVIVGGVIGVGLGYFGNKIKKKFIKI